MTNTLPLIKKVLILSLTLVTIFFLNACVTTKNSAYFRDIPDSLFHSEIAAAAFTEPTIQPDDILNVTIQTIDPQASTAINQGNISNASGTISSSSPTNSSNANGFLVDKQGNVELPLIGKVKLDGLTTYQAREVIREKAAIEFNKPTVQVRFANYKITVIGEVAKPATYILPNEKVSILDAIGLAGDLTIYGKRENILLIRDKGEKKEMVRLNLNNSNLLKSPYFYMKQNDVLYIEPNKAKVASNNASRTQTIAILSSVLSVLIVVVSRL